MVQLLVQSYDADAKDCAIHCNEFAVINGLPLYAAARAGRETREYTPDSISAYLCGRHQIMEAHRSLVFLSPFLFFCFCKGAVLCSDSRRSDVEY